MKKQIIALSVLVLLFALNSFAQVTQEMYWALPPFNIKTNLYPTSSYLPGFNSSSTVYPYVSSNAAYDDNGNVLFYVFDNLGSAPTLADVRIYLVDATGIAFAALPTYNTSTTSYVINGPEVSIVPVPDVCRQFYVIYNLIGTPGGRVLTYIKVDCSGTSPLMTVPSSNQLAYGTSGGGIAVSKLVNGNTRYLFTVDGSGVLRYTITSSGIGAQTTIVIPSQIASSTYTDWQNVQELELSPNQQYLAWSGSLPSPQNNGQVFQVNLNSSYTYSGAYYTYTIPAPNGYAFPVKGIEYAPASNRLYVCSSNGLYYLTPGSNPGLTPVTNAGSTSAYTNTQLEYNGFAINGVDNSGHLFRINQSANTVTPNINSSVILSNMYVGNTVVSNAYHLPDQIDGEDYRHFFGVALPVSNFTINNTALLGCPNSEAGFSNITVCASLPITLNNLSTNAVSYQLNMQSTDVNGVPVSGGSYLGSYNTLWRNTCFTDLKSLPGTNGNWLSNSNNSGYYTITLSTMNACGETSSYCGWIHMVGTCKTGNNSVLTDTDEAAKNDFQAGVYPNPTTGVFTLSKNTDTEAEVIIYDLMGAEVMHISKMQASAMSIDFSKHSKGVYLVRVISGANTSVFHLIYQ